MVKDSLCLYLGHLFTAANPPWLGRHCSQTLLTTDHNTKQRQALMSSQQLILIEVLPQWGRGVYGKHLDFDYKFIKNGGQVDNMSCVLFNLCQFSALFASILWKGLQW